jgi:hypothetical protein
MTVLVYDLWDSGAWGAVSVTALSLSFVLLILVILSRILLKSELAGQK